VKLLFSFRGVDEVEVPETRIVVGTVRDWLRREERFSRYGELIKVGST